VERISEGEGQSPALVRVGTSMPVVNSDLVRIDHLVGIAAISVLLAAPLTGFVLATIALRPITEMTERTHRMHPQRMEERLPPRGTNDELDRLAKVINNLLSRIAQYVRHHRGSMADAAHQLRTPLAAIRSSVEVILAADENTPENRDLLYRAVEQIESLESLVNQLLLLAETEVDTLRPAEEAVPLDTLVRSSLEMFDAVAESLGVQLEVAELQPVVVQGNRHHLRQVVNNLLDNAIKFTAIKRDEPRTVSLRLVSDSQHEIAVLEVVDTGIGIPSEQLDQVFDRFYRGGSLQQIEANVRGNGLGLSIVKSVVQSHGGTATVTSSLGDGTTFTIALPRLNVPASASA
jgi:signal transduction histidine kinase